MLSDHFNQRKKDILGKLDKSSKKSWDKKIVNLCEKINFLDNYYTTSSCAGRIVLMINQEKKTKGLFRFVKHDLINLDEFWREIEKLDLNEEIKFKQEPCILHVACRTLKDAEILLNKGREAGWKKSGVLSLGKNIVVELNSSERLEFPVVRKGGLLINKKFIQEVVEVSNEHLIRTLGKIERLNKLI